MTKPTWTSVDWQTFCQWIQGRTLKESDSVYDSSGLESSGEELVFDRGRARIFSNYSPGYSEYTPGYVSSPTVFISED